MKVDSLDGRPFALRGVLFGQLLSLLLLSDFGIGLSSTPLDTSECQKITSPPHEFKVNTFKSFTEVHEAALHVLVVFNMSDRGISDTNENKTQYVRQSKMCLTNLKTKQNVKTVQEWLFTQIRCSKKSNLQFVVLQLILQIKFLCQTLLRNTKMPELIHSSKLTGVSYYI